MPIGLPAALAIGSIGSGVATGLLDRNQTRTIRTELTPQQQQLSTRLSGKLQGNLNRPSNPPNLQPLRNRLRTSINRTTRASQSRLEDQLNQRGFGRSGRVASGFRELEADRINAFSNVEGQVLLALEEATRQQEQEDILNALLGANGGCNRSIAGGEEETGAWCIRSRTSPAACSH